MRNASFHVRSGLLLGVLLCLFAQSNTLHALPCDGHGNETCVRAKRPTTVISEQNNSPCIGCQPPPPAPNPLPTGDSSTYRGDPGDKAVCKRIVELTKASAVAQKQADLASARLPDLKNQARNYNAQLPAAAKRVETAKANVPAGILVTATSVARCTAKLRALGDCPDYDLAASTALTELRSAEDGFKRIMDARDMMDGQIARDEQSIRDANTLKARLDKLKDSEAGEACP